MARTGWFARFLLPGLAFKAAVIGGGYATGRELATFFVPSGPLGGIAGMILATMIWSAVGALTFLFAVRNASRDYRSFFRKLLGPAWPAFEIIWILALMIILSVYTAAAGAIGNSLFEWPDLAGALLLIGLVAATAAWGNRAVERLFNYASIILYGTFVIFLSLSLSRYGPQIGAAFAKGGWNPGWALGGLTYAGYNIIGAVVILPVTRHLTSERDALIAGLVAGPLAMLPAILFFVPMVAWFPGIADVALPSDFLLRRLDLPWFRVLFQVMILAALLESAVSGVHAVNERVAAVLRERRERELNPGARFLVTLVTLLVAVVIGGHFGLVALIASGYSWIATGFLLVYIVPLAIWGVAQLVRRGPRLAPADGEGAGDAVGRQ